MRRNILSFLTALGLTILLTGFVRAVPLKYNTVLSPMQVVSGNSAINSNGYGNCQVKLIRISGEDWEWYESLEVSCNFSGLSGSLIDADIRMASVGQNGEGLCTAYKHTRVTLPNNGSGNVSINCSGGSPEWAWVDPSLLLEKKLYIVLQTANYPEGELRGQIKPIALDSDVDGEGRAEISVFRPSDGVSYAYCSMNNSTISRYLFTGWQSITDSTPFSSDLDGDGLAESIFVRTNPVNGNLTFIYRWSSENWRLHQYPWGSAALGDIPALGDFYGAGRTNIAVYRQTTGAWHIRQDYGFDHIFLWGQPGGSDKPCAADYDGDGTTDLCVIREENGQFAWYIRRSSAPDQIYKVNWGLATDTFFPNQTVDVDADGANDVLVAREENGKRYFYALRSSDKSLFALQWGLPTDMVKIGDYDADGKTDFAAVREIDNQLVWFINQSSNEQMRSFNWGLPGDK